MAKAIYCIIDSGAYSAFRQQDPISVKAYGRWLLKHQHEVSAYINLDVIPGTPSATPTAKDVEIAAAAGWKNLLHLRELGLDPIPVYHKGERRYWLEKMLDEGCTYIGLGGVANAGDKARRPWLDEVFHYLCGRKGYPEVKVHGFGITSTKMMLRYPWASVDSVTWFKQGVMGSVYIPQITADGEWDFIAMPYAIGFSAGGKKGPSSISMGHATHIDTVGKQVRGYIETYVAENGMTVKQLQTEYKARVRLNARFYREFAKQHYFSPFRLNRGGLFAQSQDRAGSVSPPKRFRLIFSVGTYLEYANILKEEKIRDQLISYHRVVTGPKFDLDKFVKTGWFVRNSRPNGEVII